MEGINESQDKINQINNKESSFLKAKNYKISYYLHRLVERLIKKEDINDYLKQELNKYL
jgi:hypothetical protein